MIVKSLGHVTLELQCSEGHTWTIGMESRKAKNWCRPCKDNLRVHQEQRQLEELLRINAQQ